MDRIKFGIIGCGAISEKHGQAIKRVEGAALVAVADVVEERARAFAAKYAETSGRIYTDYRRLLENPHVDAVIVATPSGLHARMGVDALDTGKHVLIEKPLALNSEDAKLVIEKAKDVRRCVGTVHPNRYYPTSQMIYRVVREGRLGKLSHGVASVRLNRTDAYYHQAPWRGTRELDGGILFNQAWHALDLLLWYMGNVVVEAQGMMATRCHDIETEDVAFVIMKFSDGELGLLEATTNVYPRNLETTVSVFGKMGTVIQGGAKIDVLRVWRVSGDNESEYLARFGEKNPAVDDSWGHAKVLEEFIDHMRGGHTETPGVNDAVPLIELIERVRFQVKDCDGSELPRL